MDTHEHPHTNRLIHASSPYLLQHAHNPVDWYEWGEEAFEKAKREDKLVLVSIGYSACHWCHVMERESFEKEDTAAIMNKHFVCIKVDREERPDVDQIYMDAVQLLTGRGGWPLNCFTLPDGRPLHGGTYFPKKEWEQTLHSLADFYWNKREEALEFATDLTNGIKKLDLIEPAHKPAMAFEELSAVINNWKQNIDTEFGGFQWAPKFPMPNNWELFLHYAHHAKDTALEQAVHTTLTRMAEGGIYDQAGGGFARYSTDTFWKVPHFEKMLYDNAQLLSLYAHAYQQSKNEVYKDKVYQTHAFLARELTSPEGAFYSALDADSEGVEGKFYLWKQKELQQLLGEDEPLFSLYYSVDAYGNWEHESNILYRTRTDEELANLTGKPIAAIENVIKHCNEVLLAARGTRVRPGLDDKVITSWNALMIKGYADAYIVFGDDLFLTAAQRCADFIIGTLWKESTLYRIYKNGKSSIPGFSEDYAALCEALITLYEASANEQYALVAKTIMDAAIDRFYDGGRKLFYFTSRYGEQLAARKTDLNDDVIPAANSMFAKALYLLGFLFDETRYHDMADDMLRTIRPKLERFPTGYSNWMQALLWKQKGFYQVVITGKAAHENWRAACTAYLPNSIRLRVVQASALPLLQDKTPGDEAKIYVCEDKTCGLPFQEIGQAMAQLPAR